MALSIWKKLRGRSLTELGVRGAQALAAQAERRGLSPQVRVPSDAAFFKLLSAPLTSDQPPASFFHAESFLQHFRQRTTPVFFASFADRNGTSAELRRRFSASYQARVVESAGRICEGRFDLLGVPDLLGGEPLDWHREPVSGKHTPLIHWSRINYLDTEVAGDKKFTWELSRQQYLLTLGRAYWLTGDEHYAEVFAAHLNSWMDANPPKLGINWASSLEVAFRSISWLWALYFFKDSPRLTTEVLTRALKFLYLHARHLETYLSTYFSPNTHLTGEALGLYYLGTLLPEFRRAARWRNTGKRILLEQLDHHVKPDGVYFEQSTYYHRYTADFYLHFSVLARANGEALGGQVEEKLQALLDHLMYITRPDGTTPFFGDDDGGRLVMLDERAANDFRATLANGAVLFQRADYKFIAGQEAAEETLWLFGRAALQNFDRLAARPPAQLSRAFPDGGYYVMRDGWTSEDNYLLIDGGPHGADNCGHAHADALSFTLAARGRNLLVDPGTYTYTGAHEQRDWFRSSAAHNTLTIDGESSSVPGGAFTWQHIARSTTRQWITHPRFDFFAGEHDGYARLPAPATHLRSILFLKNDYWMLHDRVATEGRHQYDCHFHLAPGAFPRITQENGLAAAREPATTAVSGLEILCAAKHATARTDAGWVSECYGARTCAPVVVFSTHAHGAQDFLTLLVPRPPQARETTAHLRELEALGGRAFEIDVHDESHDLRDILLVSNQDQMETARFISNFRWAWARLAARDADLAEGHPRLAELVLIGGSKLNFDGHEMVNATGRIGYLAARRTNDDWFIETDAGNDLVFAPPGVAGSIFVNGELMTVSKVPASQSAKQQSGGAPAVRG